VDDGRVNRDGPVHFLVEPVEPEIEWMLPSNTRPTDLALA